MASCVLPLALADVEFIIVPKPPILTFVHPVSVAFGTAPIPTFPLPVIRILSVPAASMPLSAAPDPVRNCNAASEPPCPLITPPIAFCPNIKVDTPVPTICTTASADALVPLTSILVAGLVIPIPTLFVEESTTKVGVSQIKSPVPPVKPVNVPTLVIAV